MPCVYVLHIWQACPPNEWLLVVLQPAICASGALINEVWTSYVHATPPPRPPGVRPVAGLWCIW